MIVDQTLDELRAEFRRLEQSRAEMAAIIRHFMAAPPDELTVRKRTSFETAEYIYTNRRDRSDPEGGIPGRQS